MADLTPENREEFWLKGVIDGKTTLTPNNRKEYWLKGMVDGETNLTPNKRSEYWYKEIIDTIGSGGGGSSDFSVANVTLTNASGESLNFSWPVVYEENEMGEGAPATVYDNVFIDDNETKIIKIPLYKGSALIEIDAVSFTVTGNISEVFPGSYLVTGDGTITIS